MENGEPIIQRKYSVAEIDKMRWLVTDLIDVEPRHGWPKAKSPSLIEERLRTYMVAGVTVEEMQSEFEALHEADEAEWFASNNLTRLP